jgi:hypothetical protein
MILSDLLQKATGIYPVSGFETETCVIADLYKQKLTQLKFFPYQKKVITISFSLAQAFAINSYLSATSDTYNKFIRIYLEPKLPICKAIEVF